MLIRDFRNQFGTSVGAYVRDLRLQETFRLLQETSWNIETTARAVGYQSPKNLYSAVRRVTGLTPAGLRCRPRRSIRNASTASLARPA